MTIIITKNGKDAKKIDKSDFEKEEYLQKVIYENPESIPLYDIKEDIELLVLCREFPTNSGPIDALGVDKDGNIYLVETKLYKNPDKRLVVAQVLDYGASLWKGYTFEGFINQINSVLDNKFKVSLNQKIKEFFDLDDDEVQNVINNIGTNLKDGNLKFVVLMNKLYQQLKDLIIFINQNSEFDIYAVELEYYKHEAYEILIPKIYGAEVKKDVKTGSVGKQWGWESFKQRLKDFGEEEVTAAEHIIKWLEKNNVKNSWSTSQQGSFIPCFCDNNKEEFYPFSIWGNGKIIWNAWHQGDCSPPPFDNLKKRLEILKRMKSVKGAIVDIDGRGNSALKLSLRVLANEDSRREFFAVLLWIKKILVTESSN